MRYLSMANGTKDLLASKETRKSSRIRVSIRKSDRHTILPGDTLRTRKKISQKLVLTAKLHINDTASQARRTASLSNLVNTSHRFLGILDGFELGITVHGLSSRALHDDMDGAGVDETGLSAKELDDFLLRDRVGDP